ncbi:hypothetical protein HW45_03500 [Vibrio sp. ER1A]|nr:hypothetical protein HW45_03500 [Vibrio sp. ER1A]
MNNKLKFIDDVAQAHIAEEEEVALALLAGGVSTSQIKHFSYPSKPHLNTNMIVCTEIRTYLNGQLFHIEPINTLVLGF